MWSVLFSVACFGGGVYINTRAWMLLSPFFVSWHMLVVRAVLWFSAPPSLSSNAPLIGSSGARAGAIFFYQSSSHPISRLLDYLRGCSLLLGCHHIHIAPLLAPLPSTR